MYKKLVGFLTVLFLAFNVNALVADSYQTYQAGETYAGACNYDYLSTYGLNTENPVNMTPIYRLNCAYGSENTDNDHCAVIEEYCNPGEYLDLTGAKPTCKACPHGSWCPRRNLSINTDNEALCGGAEYVYAGGKTAINANREWKDGKCIIIVNGTEEEVTDNGNPITKDKCIATSVGRCACPEGTTTGANSSSGMNATSKSHCSFYKLDPGQQLQRTGDATNGYNFSVATCEADHYCEGGIIDTANYSYSMSACPAKYVTVDDKSSSPTMQGTSDAGSFRCAYTCPAGYYMHVQYNGWKNAYSTCEPCTEGYYCPGGGKTGEQDESGDDIYADKTYFIDEQYGDTVYHEDTYDTEQNKYTGSADPGRVPCGSGKTTNGTGKKSADDCVVYVTCSAGKYLQVYNTQPSNCVTTGSGINCWDVGGGRYAKCEPCTTGEMDYCPGGTFTADQAGDDGKVGVNQCRQQNIVDSDGTPIYNLNDSGNKEIVPNTARTACVCPDQYDATTNPSGKYEWDTVALACVEKGYGCRPGNRYSSDRICCGPGEMSYVYNDGTFGYCMTCEDGWENTSNAVYCSGVTIQMKCDLKPNGYRSGSSCKICPEGSEHVFDDNVGDYTSCRCDKDLMKAVYNSDNTKFPEYGVDPDITDLRYFNGSACVYHTYSVEVWYNDIKLNGITYDHGKSCGWSGSCPYWSKSYTWADNWFDIKANHTPALHGYTFSNPETPRVSKSGNGFVFAGWCRGTQFCCPKDYQVATVDGLKECQKCADGDNSVACSGNLYTVPGVIPNANNITKYDKTVIDPKDVNDRATLTKYYAMLLEIPKGCAAGEYLDTGSLSCKDCPKGHWCPGGQLSVTNPGKNPCDPGKYNELTNQSAESACLSCKDLVNVPAADNALTTKSSGTESHTKCGYYCNAGKYAADGTYNCDETCTAKMVDGVLKPAYCPGGGPTNYGYASAFYYYTEPGQGRFVCPKGLTSSDGAYYCKMPHCDAKKYVKYVNGEYVCVPCEEHVGCTSGAEECFDGNDQSISGITNSNDCTELGYTWDNGSCFDKSNRNISNILTETQCTTLGYKWANNTGCRTYYYCPGGDNIPVYLNYSSITHSSTAKLEACGSGKMAYPAPADQCYPIYNAGRYQKPDGTYDVCPTGSFCPGSTQGTQKCPAGSISEPGASSVFDCKCLSGEDYQPGGVYAEKGGFIQYDTNTSKYVCVNTYLAVENVNSYENAESCLQNAEARVVSCQWVSDTTVSEEAQQTTGTYKKCTNKAMTICEKTDWSRDIIGVDTNNAEDNHIAISDVLQQLAYAFGGENMTIPEVLASMTNLSSGNNIKQITKVGSCNCASESEACPEGFSHYDDINNICYAALDYDLGGGHLAANTENPERYTADDLAADDIILNNPAFSGHIFKGWCEDDNSCLLPSVNMSIVEGATGDKWFYARWANLCPETHPLYGDDAYSIDQCYRNWTCDINDLVCPAHSQCSYANPQSGTEYYHSNNVNEQYVDNEHVQCDIQYTCDTGYSAYHLDEYGVGAGLIAPKPETDDLYGYRTTNGADDYVFPAIGLHVSHNYTGLDRGEWFVTFADGTVVKGTTMDGTAFVFSEADTVQYYNQNCWCKVTSYQKPSADVVPVDSAWVNILTVGQSSENTESRCANECAKGIVDNNFSSNLDTVIWSAVKNAIRQCKPIDYTIHYVTNGGECVNNACDDVNYTIESEDITLPTVNDIAKTGQIFAGWYNNATLEGEPVTVVGHGSIGDKTFYAKWTDASYTVSYTCGGTAAANDTVQNVTYNQPYTDGVHTVADICSKDYYTPDAEFVCVKAGSEPAEAVIMPEANENWNIASNVVCNAGFTANVYRITYNVNGGECSDSACDEEVYTVESEDITLPTVEYLNYDNHTFKGWCLASEDSATCAENNPVIEGVITRTVTPGTGDDKAHTDLTFVANWRVDVCPDGYDFTDNDNPETFAQTDCYATVEYDTNGGTPVPSMIKKYYAGTETYKLTVEEIPSNVSKQGHELVGWYDNRELLGDSVNIESEFSGDIMLYADWTPYQYTVKFNANGGSGEMPDQEFTYGIQQKLRQNSFVKSGSSFSGWCDNWNSETQTCSGTIYLDEQQVSDLTAEKDGSVTLYAMWELNTYTVSFDDTYGTKESVLCTVSVDCDIVYNDEFSRLDYAVVGWATEQGGEKVYESTDKINQATATDIKLYAVWEPVCSGKYLNVGNYKLCLYPNPHSNPRLAIKLADGTYYANMTPVPSDVSVPGKKMSSDAPQRLHIKYGDTIYDVHDLTVE